MFSINEDMSIYATRGDIVFFSVTAEDNGAPHIFKAGDVVRLKVYEKKAADSVLMQKVVNVTQDTEMVEFLLSGNDTKFGDVISKPTDYWYEVELNPFSNPQTIIGYDENGAKIFRLYPEGADVVPDIEPEDIPIVDAELDPSSERPIQNQAVTRAFAQVVTEVNETISGAKEALNELTAYAEHLDIENPHKVTAKQVGAVSNEDAIAKAGTTTFNADGSITTTYEDGTSEETIFNADGSITSIRYVEGVAVFNATTTFNADGSITTTCEVKEGEEDELD